MDLDTYIREFKDTSVNYPIDGKFRQAFLMLDDQGTKPGYLPWCGAKCSLHKFTLTSEIEQEIVISGHTWPKRTYPAQCIATGSSGNNNMRITGVEKI